MRKNTIIHKEVPSEITLLDKLEAKGYSPLGILCLVNGTFRGTHPSPLIASTALGAPFKVNDNVIRGISNLWEVSLYNEAAVETLQLSKTLGLNLHSFLKIKERTV